MLVRPNKLVSSPATPNVVALGMSGAGNDAMVFTVTVARADGHGIPGDHVIYGSRHSNNWRGQDTDVVFTVYMMARADGGEPFGGVHLKLGRR